MSVIRSSAARNLAILFGTCLLGWFAASSVVAQPAFEERVVAKVPEGYAVGQVSGYWDRYKNSRKLISPQPKIDFSADGKTVAFVAAKLENFSRNINGLNRANRIEVFWNGHSRFEGDAAELVLEDDGDRLLIHELFNSGRVSKFHVLGKKPKSKPRTLPHIGLQALDPIFYQGKIFSVFSPGSAGPMRDAPSTCQLVIDGRKVGKVFPGRPTEDVLCIARKGRRFGFVIRGKEPRKRTEGFWIVSDKGESDRFDEAHSPVISPDGKRLVAAVRKGRRWHIWDDGDLSEKSYLYIGPPSFTPDGKVAIMASDARDQLAVFVDGKKVSPQHEAWLPVRARFSYVECLPPAANRKGGVAYVIRDIRENEKSDKKERDEKQGGGASGVRKALRSQSGNPTPEQLEKWNKQSWFVVSGDWRSRPFNRQHDVRITKSGMPVYVGELPFNDRIEDGTNRKFPELIVGCGDELSRPYVFVTRLQIDGDKVQFGACDGKQFLWVTFDAGKGQ